MRRQQLSGRGRRRQIQEYLHACAPRISVETSVSHLRTNPPDTSGGAKTSRSLLVLAVAEPFLSCPIGIGPMRLASIGS